MRWVLRFVLSSVAAVAAALFVQSLFMFLPPVEVTQSDEDLGTILLLLVVLNLATVVTFVVVQTRMLGWMLGFDYRELVAPSTMGGPLAMMLAFVIATQTGSAHQPALMGGAFLVGQLGLAFFLRRAADGSRSESDDSPQS